MSFITIQETEFQQEKDAKIIFTRTVNCDFITFAEAEYAVTQLYIPDPNFSRVGICHALDLLEKYYPK